MAEPWQPSSRRSSSLGSANSFSSQSSRTSRPAPSYFPEQYCRTCYRRLHVDGPFVGECLLLCISTGQSRKGDQILEDLPEAVALPTRVQEYTALFDEIWFDFQVLKDMNEKDRQYFSSKKKERGSLKQNAPIPWLSYRRPDGKTGQTRNQENYDIIWQKSMAHQDGKGPSVRFLTLKTSDLAQNARRSHLSDDETRYENLFTPSGTPSVSSSGWDSPIRQQFEISSIPREDTEPFPERDDTIDDSSGPTTPISNLSRDIWTTKVNGGAIGKQEVRSSKPRDRWSIEIP